MITSDKIAMWSMFGTWVSAIASIVTLFLAAMALNTWKQQEKLKAKKDFKMALLEMHFITIWLPKMINVEQLMIGRRILYEAGFVKNSDMEEDQIKLYEGYALEFDKLEEIMKKCWLMWTATESLFKSTKIVNLWKGVFKAYNEYTQGREDQDYFLKSISSLTNEDLYFTR